MSEVDDEIFTVCTVQETTKFVISGVADPNSEKIISLDEALSRGVIDQQRGLYWYVAYTLFAAPLPRHVAELGDAYCVIS